MGVLVEILAYGRSLLIIIAMLIIVVFMPISTVPVYIAHKRTRGVLIITLIPLLVAMVTFLIIYFMFGGSITEHNIVKYYCFVPVAYFFAVFIITANYF